MTTPESRPITARTLAQPPHHASPGTARRETRVRRQVVARSRARVGKGFFRVRAPPVHEVRFAQQAPACGRSRALLRPRCRINPFIGVTQFGADSALRMRDGDRGERVGGVDVLQGAQAQHRPHDARHLGFVGLYAPGDRALYQRGWIRGDRKSGLSARQQRPRRARVPALEFRREFAKRA